MSEDRATITIHIPADPTQPMTAEIEGDLIHKHIMASHSPVVKAFRRYMIEKARVLANPITEEKSE